MVRFLNHYVTDGAVKAPVWYHLDNRADGRKCVTLYAKSYGGELGKIFQAGEYKNDSDLMSDYFDKGRVVLFESHELYAQARQRADVARASRDARRAKHVAKRQQGVR